MTDCPTECPHDGCDFTVTSSQSYNAHAGQVHKDEQIPPDGYDNSKPDEWRAKMTGRSLSEEHKQAISDGEKGAPITDEQKQKISETLTGRSLSESRKQAISEAMKGRTLSEEHKRKIGEANRKLPSEKDVLIGPKQSLSAQNSGSGNPFYGRTHTEKTRKKLSEANSGENHAQYGLTGEDNPQYGWTHTEESRRNMSVAQKRAWREGRREITAPQTIEVEETGHTVNSGPEAEFDRELHHANVEYCHEPVFSLETRTYKPDFQIDDMVVEVKGWPVTDHCIQRAIDFMAERPGLTYIILGTTEESHEVPCDRFVAWEDREELYQP